MMLRASIDVEPGPGAPDGERAPQAVRAAVLEGFVDAVVGDDTARADEARAALVEQLGLDWLIDASAVVANFEMMTRIADGTGARLRAEQLEAAAPIIAALGLDRFASARH